ncbi:ubiquitin-like autophagy protein Apg12-domain-containing protein [Neohortaea acidophila]|uniref:Ubiquitin-like protein ATG12 n=1 Tax=Neohortaea acidophila TaxID=245834 RepID=A0A6A6PZK6_9PEZI|nr:ubiquitin-like autophagy protein Apg12-domain-containing protein [Neohortaea acidophila]KAF2485452.1 ubiquitin-like autophagy protein Apg12-domain-containing protein [Neohortaea acidophila]
MTSTTSTPTPPDAMAEEEDNGADLPMTMAASVILEHLPKDAHAALETAGELKDANGQVKSKVKVRLSPLPNTKALRTPVFNCGTAQRFEFVVRFLRKRLQLKDHESVFCYVNSVFAPGLDEGVGNLWRCFKVGDELVVSYSVTQAFG